MSSRPTPASSTRSSGSGAAPSASRCLKTTWPDLADALITTLIGAACAACSRTLDTPSRGPVCQRCWASVAGFATPVCERCGRRLEPPQRAAAGALVGCARCARHRWALDRLQAAGPYAGALRDIVRAFKYGGHRSLAGPLAELVCVTCAETIAGVQFAVPVPLHPVRRWSRGFNQADDLARRLGIPVVRALARSQLTASQARLASGERRSNVRQAFRLRRVRLGLPPLRGARVLLVDDVCTTGATLEACARTLREAGVEEVRAVTVARAVHERS